MARTLSIIIPCYNEERTLRAILERVATADTLSWRKEVIVVDDGSTDGSRTILKQYKNRPSFKVIFREENGGKGAAEHDGMAAATGDYLFLQDADLEYDPTQLPKLLQVVDETSAPIVFGSRNITNGWHRKGAFLVSLGVKVSTELANFLYQLRLTDAWTCYKLFSREVATKARFIGNGFEADYLFIGEAAAAGFPIVEVPIEYVPRTREEGKKIRYVDGLRAMWLFTLRALPRWRPLRYVLAGGTASATNLLLLYIGADLLGVWYVAAAAVSLVLATTLSFALQKWWTFADRTKGAVSRQAVWYVVASIAGIGANLLMMYALVETLHLHYLIAQIIAAVAVALGSFFFYRAIIFTNASR